MHACTLRFVKATPETKQAVVEAARTWLGDRDPATVSLREVARALGTTPTSMYRHFDSMHDLRVALGLQQGTRPVVAEPPTSVPESFTDSFVDRAASPERIRTVIAELMGETFSIGPIGVGPGQRAKAVAQGRVGTIEVVQGPNRTLHARVPVSLQIVIVVGRMRKNVAAHIVVPITIAPQVNGALELLIDVVRPRPSAIAVTLDERRMSANVLKIGRIDSLLRAQTITYIDTVLDSPAGRAATVIDLGDLIDTAWQPGMIAS